MIVMDIEDRIKKIIARELGCDVSSIKSEDNLKYDLCADSLDIYEIRCNVENAFDICFTDEELQDLLRIDAIVEIVQNKIDK